MGWNKTENKSLADVETKVLSVGAPIAYTPGVAGRPYKDGWNIERAYRDGVAKITWVFRAIDAIAGNQAKLPIILREGNTSSGKIVENDSNLLNVLNSVSNMGESSFAFRYRLSSQLLMSTRGVFIEIIRNNAGEVASLHLLPPQDTAPIPHPTKFVSGYEVDMPDGNKKVLKPEDVLWVRRPHPLDPYRSITPMEASGVAIEIEQLAKLYNRNFLINDGRPGGLLVLRGEIEDDDREELTSRFRGNIRSTGSVSVIASEDGADFVDLGSNPRDIAYQQMRAVTKEEILAAFGVPESVIGNASGRTFSNAAEEGKVFWQETMSPHLEMISRSFDQLDDTYYVDFDTGKVPILILSKQESESYLMNEFSSGLISANEYRKGTGREPVVSELSDALLANPSLTPIGNTEKAMEAEQPQEPALPGAEPAPGADQAGLPIEVTQNDVPVMDSTQNPEIFGDQEGQQLTDVSQGGAPVKTADSLETKVTSKEETEDLSKWEAIVERTVDDFFVRQHRVVMEKARSKKVGRAVESGTLTIDMLFDNEVWDKQLDDDLRPLITQIMVDAADSVSVKAEDLGNENVNDFADEQLERSMKINDTTEGDIATAILVANTLKESGGESSNKAAKVAFLVLALGAIYAVKKRREEIAENETISAYNSGMYLSGQKSGAKEWTWVTRGDDRVRSSHRMLDGKTVPVGQGFALDGKTLRFPGDPLAPADLTIGCRCRLKFG